MGEMTRLIYVDDSGAVTNGGLIVYGWVEVEPASWRVALRTWLDLRKELFRDYHIPVSQELHSTEYINGRGRISPQPPVRFVHGGTVYWKDLGREVAEKCLATLAACDAIKVGAVYRKDPRGGREYGQSRYDVYSQLVANFNCELGAADSFGFITMDGQDQGYRQAHRALPLNNRHVIEDPAFHDSKNSQWTQMADLVAYSVNIHLNRYRGIALGHDWYSKYLQGSDVNAQVVHCP